MLKLKNKGIFILFLVSVLLPVIWFRNNLIMGTGESGLPFYDLERQYQVTKNSWTDFGLGNSWGIGTGASSFFLITSKIQSLGIPGYLIEASFFGFLLFISGLSIWLLVKDLFPSLGNKFVLLSVFVYWFNPISLVNVWGRFLYSYMAFFALLPLSFYLFLRGIKTKKYLFSVLIGLSCGLLSYALTSTPFDILLWFLFFITTFFYLVVSKNLKEKIFLITYLLSTFISFILINFWWLGQLFSFIFSSDYNATTSAFFTQSGNVSTLTDISDRLGKFINTYAFLHATFFLTGPEWAKFFLSPLFYLVGFLVIGISFWIIYKYRTNEKILFFGLLLVLSFFLIKGNSEPFGAVFEFFFARVSALQVFRNPFEKFGFLLPLVVAPLFSFGLSDLLENVKNTNLRNIFFGLMFFFIVVLWGMPFWTGLVFTSNEGTSNNITRSYNVQTPSYYKTASDWLLKYAGDFRFVSLPLGGEAINYNWDKPYVGVELSSTFFTTPGISFNTTTPYYNDLVAELSRYQINKGILSFFPFVSAKYIVWRDDIDYKFRQIPNPEITHKILENWAEQGLVSKDFETAHLVIYKLNDSLYWPKIYTTSDINVSNSKDLSYLSNFLNEFPKTKSVVVDENINNKKLNFNKMIIVPDKVYIQKVTSPLPKNLTDEQLLGKLFYASHLPGDITYPFIRLNEKILEIREKNHDGWMLYKVGILGKRIAEIYKLEKLGKSKNLIVSTKKDYENELAYMSPYIIDLINSNDPIAEVIKDSLVYQWVLLSRVDLSSTTTSLSDLLSKWNVKPTFELPASSNSYVISSFKLPIDGKYILYGVDRESIFLDGKKLIGKDKLLDLTSGDHEISLNLDDSGLFKTVVNSPNDIVFDDKNKQHFDFGIPNVPKTYEVDFDYRFVRGDLFAVKIVQDLENEDSPSFNNNIYKNSEYHGWVHFNSEMKNNDGATSAYLAITPAKENLCQKLWWGWNKCTVQNSNFEIEIKNLTIKEVDTPEISLVTDSNVDIQKNTQDTTTVSFTKINPTLYKAHINKNNSNPEILVFSELFNTYWKVTYQDGNQISESNHLLVNDYANGWVIDKQGDYDISISFAPQTILNFGVKVSFYSSLTAICVLLISIIWRKKHEVS